MNSLTSMQETFKMLDQPLILEKKPSLERFRRSFFEIFSKFEAHCNDLFIELRAGMEAIRFLELRTEIDKMSQTKRQIQNLAHKIRMHVKLKAYGIVSPKKAEYLEVASKLLGLDLTHLSLRSVLSLLQVKLDSLDLAIETKKSSLFGHPGSDK